jgi:peptidoglycan/LPS O-acetylase OafA/YrhL
LIFQSMQRSSSLESFYWKRFLRLFPGLFIALLLTVCLAGFIYTGSWQEYLANSEMWSYIPSNLALYHLQFGISGVLNGDAINGSLWTIRYEFSFYILISGFFIFREKKDLVKKVVLFFFTFFYLGKIFLFRNMGTAALTFADSLSLNLGLFFMGGAVLAAIKIDKSKYKFLLIATNIVLLIVSFFLTSFYFIQFFALPFLVILIGISSTKYISSLSDHFGDISYGIYIYSFPVQQVLHHFFDLNYLQLMGMSLAASFLLGYLSWNLIEKQALRFKNHKSKTILAMARN